MLFIVCSGINSITFSPQRDFKPIALQHAYIAPVRMPEARVDTLPKFNAETSNKFFFKKWDVGPRKRYVDFHEGHKYIPPQEVFDGKSTTRETFKGEKTAVRPPFKPAQHAVAGGGAHRLPYHVQDRLQRTFHGERPQQGQGEQSSE